MLSADPGEKPPDGPEHVLQPGGAPFRRAHQHGDALCDQFGVLGTRQRTVELGAHVAPPVALDDPARLADELGDGPERDALPVGQAAPAQDQDVGADRGDELPGQT